MDGDHAAYELTFGNTSYRYFFTFSKCACEVLKKPSLASAGTLPWKIARRPPFAFFFSSYKTL